MMHPLTCVSLGLEQTWMMYMATMGSRRPPNPLALMVLLRDPASMNSIMMYLHLRQLSSAP